MPTVTPESRPATQPATRPASLLAGLLILLLCLSGCSLPFGGDDDQQPGQADDPVEDVRNALIKRARAIKGDVPQAFRATLAPDDQRLRRAQVRYFNNLQQLPLERFSYRVLPTTVRSDGSEVLAEVELRMQLRDFDAVPVRTRWLYHFRRTASDELVLTQAVDREFLRSRDIELSPWDMTAIEVRRTPGALGIFDADSVGSSTEIMGAVQRGIDEVSDVVPYAWDERVVVYALSDVKVLAQLDNLPGGDADRLDGVAFPVRARDVGNRLASMRFMLHPRMLTRDPEGRDRLIRHELTHVALRARDDHVPTWLAEGIAEWTSVRPVPTSQRLISRDALTRAQAGLTSLPSDKTFNGPQSSGNYGIAWWACDYIVEEYGEEVLWQLFERMGKGAGTGSADQDPVLRDVLKMDGDQLAAAAGQRIVATFG